MAKDHTGNVPLPLLSAALDDVWTLRAAGAYEAALLRAAVGLRTMPRTARETLAACAGQLDDIAAGRSKECRDAATDIEHDIEDSGLAPQQAAQWERHARSREQMHLTDATAPTALYARTLGEVVAARELIAQVAYWLGGLLHYRSLPARAAIRDQIARLAQASEGDPLQAYSHIGITELRHALRRAGLPVSLTRANYESETSA